MNEDFATRVNHIPYTKKQIVSYKYRPANNGLRKSNSLINGKNQKVSHVINREFEGLILDNEIIPKSSKNILIISD